MCGGLPAPEAANNPLGYKFSWYPKGVLLSGLNAARYRKENRTVEVPGDRVYHSAEPVEIEPCFALEVLPNRDSMHYLQAYGLPNVHTMFRGTLRYKGFSLVLATFQQLGLLDSAPLPALAANSPPISWPALLTRLLGAQLQAGKSLQANVLHRLGLDVQDKRSSATRVIAALEWLGILDEAQLVPARGTPIDSLCALLTERLSFGRDERDMVLLSHEFHIAWTDCTERRTTTLLAYGEVDGYSAMAKTVGVPVAIAAQMILNNEIKAVGVHAPFSPDIYLPMLDKLKAEGICFVENSIYHYQHDESSV